MSRLNSIIKNTLLIASTALILEGCAATSGYIQPKWAIESEYIGPTRTRLTKEDLLEKTLQDFKSSNLFNSEYVKSMENRSYSVEQKIRGGVNDTYNPDNQHSTLFVDNKGDEINYLNEQLSMLGALTHVEAHYMWNEVLSEGVKQEFVNRIFYYHQVYEAIHQYKELLPPVEERPELHAQLIENFGFTPETFNGFRHYRELQDRYENTWPLTYYTEEAYTNLIQTEMTEKFFVASIANELDETPNFYVDDKSINVMKNKLNTITKIPPDLIKFYDGFIHDRYITKTDSLE
ncbi:MAG: hypothetical protein ABIB43_05200 [archaeon]